MKFAAALGGLALLVASPSSSAGPGCLDHTLLLEDVEVRSEVTADIHVAVFVNERSSRCISSGRALLALQGIGFTAASWEPLSDALFARRRGLPAYCRLYAIDLPGRGESPLPEGMPFSDTSLDDLLTSFRNAWQRLAQLDRHIDTVVGHSRGALLTQMLQDQLLSEGSSLRSEFGAKDAVLLGASPPAAIDWSAASPALLELLSQFVTFSPERGVYAEAPPEAWAGISYTNFAGVPHPEVPLSDLPRHTSPESLPSVLAVFGFAPFARPEVAPGIFAPARGTRLTMIAFSQDPFGLIPEQEALYEYLTGDRDLTRLAMVEDEFAVHNLYNAEPELVLEALARRGRLLRSFGEL